MKKKTILSMILVTILTSSLISCSNEQSNNDVASTDSTISVDEIDEDELDEDMKKVLEKQVEKTAEKVVNEEITKNDNKNIDIVYVEENDGGLNIIVDDEKVAWAPAVGGTMGWLHITDSNTALNYSYLVSDEMDSKDNVRTYRYKKYSPNYNEDMLAKMDDEKERENYISRFVASTIASETVFKYMGDGTIELINDKADAKLENRSTQELGVNYMITVNGVDTYKITRYDTGRVCLSPNDEGGNDSRIEYGWKIETLKQNDDIKLIDAITVALIIASNLYVFY
ncbi:hypothetical protein P5E41_08200 [Clostridium perfringens]|uniref:hypothetical protein n=1 Tax=Clostridium perfringens TaxID=1502 RepID=UPI001ABA3577|nr:hypothetical protein [Clostridium perfringens]MBO3339410.1 hypothetical protein [Clostridium perfringens]MDK0843271.1 hypothetical protein [Clostridium perfringens]MDM1007756.1 hypothetical protein [Clostridium perfringens]